MRRFYSSENSFEIRGGGVRTTLTEPDDTEISNEIRCGG